MKEAMQINVPKELKKKFREKAKRKGFTMNAMIIILIEKYLKKED